MIQQPKVEATAAPLLETAVFALYKPEGCSSDGQCSRGLSQGRDQLKQMRHQGSKFKEALEDSAPSRPQLDMVHHCGGHGFCSWASAVQSWVGTPRISTIPEFSR